MDVQRSVRQRGRARFSLPVVSGYLDGAITTTLNMAHATTVMDAARTNPVVRATLEKVLMDTVDCSFSIRMRYGADNIELPESEQRAIAAVWPSFVREVLWHIQVIGLVVVAANRSTRMPRVVPLQYARVMFRESVREARIYWVEEPTTNKRLDALVFAKYHPAPASGMLMSPAASVLQHVARYDRVLANQDDADYQATHPVWAFETERNGAGRPSPIEHDEFVQGEVLEQYAAWHANIADEVSTSIEHSQRMAQQNYSAAVVKASRAAAVPAGALAAPFLNNFHVPINQRLATTPTPTINAHLQFELELIESKILQAFRVPPGVMETTHAMRYAAQPEAAQQQWGMTIRSMQRELAAMMAETYMFVAADVFAAYADAIVGRVAAERAAAIESVVKRAESDAVGAPPERNDDGVLQMPESDESMQRAARVLAIADRDIIAHLRAKLSVSVEFHCRPTLQLPQLAQLYAEGLISRDTYAERAAELVGMAPSAFLIGTEAQEKDARERKRIADIMQPPEENTPAPKKRPAADD
jgi:hypothetical protein